MKLTNENLKKAGIFNSILIVIAVALRIINLNKVPSIIRIESIVCILSLLFGLIYSLNGYKKESAKYYMTFMILFSLNIIISLCMPITEIINGEITTIAIVIGITQLIMLVCTIMLSFAENLGKDKSVKVSYIVLLLEIINTIIALSNGLSSPIASSSLSHLIQGFIVCLLVNAKYEDKETRGAR